MISRKNSLSNFDIMKIIQSQGVEDFNGVYMKDQLPNKLERGSYIVNLQSSKEGNGTHWVCFYHTPTFSYYYDSYGFVHLGVVLFKFWFDLVSDFILPVASRMLDQSECIAAQF